MQPKLSKLQKTIILYIAIMLKSNSKRYIKRTDITKGLMDKLDKKNKEVFRVTLSVSINSLIRRGLLSKYKTNIGLTKEGKETAKLIREQIIEEYGKINWEVIKIFCSGIYDKQYKYKALLS